MCGITGYLVNKPINKNILVSMNEVMINRGPDSSGYYYDRGICWCNEKVEY